MKMEQVGDALEVAYYAPSTPGGVCGLAFQVQLFLQQLKDHASWWQRIVLGVVIGVLQEWRSKEGCGA